MQSTIQLEWDQPAVPGVLFQYDSFIVSIVPQPLSPSNSSFDVRTSHDITVDVANNFGYTATFTTSNCAGSNSTSFTFSTCKLDIYVRHMSIQKQLPEQPLHCDLTR